MTRTSPPRTSLLIGSDSSPNIRESISELVDRAEDVVVVASFLFTSSLIADSLVRASERGVRVYVMTAATTGLALRKRSVEALDKEKAKLHREVLRQIAGRCSVRSSDYWHSKFVLIDPRSDHRQGGLLSSNLNDGAMLSSPEILMHLRPDEVTHCFELARFEFWSAQFETSDATVLSKPSRGFALPHESVSTRVIDTCSDTNRILEVLVSQIERCDEELSLSSYQFHSGSPVVASVGAAVGRGVRVRVLAHPDDQGRNQEALRPIVEGGGEVRWLPWIHSKFCLSDRDSGTFTSQNMENYSSEDVRRFELALHLDPERLRQAYLWFDYWWNQAQLIRPV